MNYVSAALAEHAVASSSSSSFPSASSAQPAPPVSGTGRTWPRALAALEVRNYRLYLSSQMLATTGLWMQRIAQDWLVLELTHSVTAVGIAVALQFLPVLLLGLVGGLVVDRFPKRTLLIITQTAIALTATTLGVLALTGAVQAWHVYVVAAVLGLITVVDNPTRQVFVSELVGSRHIRNAVSLNSSVFQLGALVGPAASGALIHAVGQGWSFLLNALSCLVVVVMVCVIRTQPAPRAAGGSGKGQLKAGLRAVTGTSEIGWTIVLVGTVGVFGLNMPVILAAFADQVFPTGVSGYSLFSSATAVGALSGAIVSARRTGTVRLRSLVAALTLLGGSVMVAALSPDRWVFVALLTAVGFCTLTFLTGANSLVQTTAGAEVRGRVMSIYLLVLLGGQSLGGPAVGWLIDHVGARPSMFVCGGLVAIVATATGLAMAHHSHLKVAWRTNGRHLPVHIVHG